MSRAVLMIVTALSLHGERLPAQSASALAGKWSGKMAPANGQPIPIFIELNVTGGSITGRVSGPDLAREGTIRKGTFQPATGAVTFEVAVEGENTVVNFDGKFAKDSIAGKVSSNTNVAGEFRIGRATLPNLTPPKTAADSLSMALQAGFAQVSGWVTKAAQMVPPDKYNYKPVGTVRSFGQVVAHVVDSYGFYCGRGAGKNVQWSDATLNGPVDKTTLATKLKQASDACNASYTSPKHLPPLMENIGHTNLHYGNIVTYMRMLGLVPPSS